MPQSSLERLPCVCNRKLHDYSSIKEALSYHRSGVRVGGHRDTVPSSRFKGLDLIERVPKELWMEVHNIVHEAVIKTIPKKKKCKKATWLSEEALQIAEKRQEVKGKEEKERYIHLNTEFQKNSKGI